MIVISCSEGQKMQIRSLSILVVLLGVLVLPVMAAGDAYGKVAIVTLTYTGNGMQVVSSEIQYGSAPNLNIQSGTLTGILRDKSGNPIREFSLRDPRYVTGDRAASDTGQAGDSLSGYLEYNPAAEFSLTVPYTTDLQTIDLIDSTTGATLTTVDLSEALQVFRGEYPNDPDIPAAPESGTASFPGLMYLLVAGIILISGSGFAYYRLYLRKQPTTILIVDDDKDITELFSTLLTQQGYRTIPVLSGEECLNVLKKSVRKPDLILLDIMMYPMDGWETLENIKKNPDLKKIPVLMITAKQPTPAEALKYGICIEDYVLKPIRPKELFGAVEYVLIRRKLISKDVSAAMKAGVDRGLVCDYARLKRRVDVERKLIGILRTGGGGIPETVPGKGVADINAVRTSLESHEEMLAKIQSQMTSAISSKTGIKIGGGT